MSTATFRRGRVRPRRPLRLATAAAIALSLGAVPSAHAELVSKLPGASGLPFPGQLVDATPDGRYVLLKVTARDGTPEATGPEADLEALAPFVLRDRVADTTTSLQFRVEPGAPAFYAQPTQISDDGDRIVIEGSAPELLAFTGGEFGVPQAVFDRSEGKLLKLPSTPAGLRGVASGVQLSADGTRALIRTITPYGEPPKPSLWRGPLGGTATAVLDLPDVYSVRASDDLETVIYERTAKRADRPDPEPNRSNAEYGRIVGLVHGSAAPRVIAESSRREKRADGSIGTCVNERDVVFEVRSVGEARISPNGSRAAWRASHLPYGADFLQTEQELTIRTAGGETSSPFVRSTVIAFGNANLTRFEMPAGAWTGPHEELVKGETELIASGEPPEYGGPSPAATRYTEATPFNGAPVPPSAPITLTDEPVDTADRPSVVTWYSCPAAPADAPVGTFEDYVKLYVSSTPAASYQLGSATVLLKPSSALREATKVTTEVTAFGIPIWRKQVATSTYFGLPKPLAYVPQVLRVTVQPRAVPGQAAPAPIVRSRSIYTTKLR